MSLQQVLHVVHDLAVKEVYNPLGHCCIFLGVGNHNDGGSLLVELGKQVHYLLAVLGIQVSGRLVRQNQLGIGDNGAGNGHSLLLATLCCWPPESCCGKCFAR